MKKKWTPYATIIFLVVCFGLHFLASMARLRPDNEDDLSTYYLYSESLFRNPGLVFALQDGREPILAQCNGDALCLQRTGARLSGHFNYAATSSILRLTRDLTTKTSDSFCERIARSVPPALLLLHALSYLLALGLVWRLKDPVFSSALVLFTFVGVVTGPMIFNLSPGPNGLEQLSWLTRIVPPVSDSFAPYIYVARGVLIQVFILMSSLFISGRLGWIAPLALLSTSLHAVQSLTTNGILLGAMGLSLLLQSRSARDWRSFAAMFVAVVINLLIVRAGSLSTPFVMGMEGSTAGIADFLRPNLLVWLALCVAVATLRIRKKGERAGSPLQRWLYLALTCSISIEVFHAAWTFFGPATDTTLGEMTGRVEAAGVPILYGLMFALPALILFHRMSRRESATQMSWSSIVPVISVILLALALYKGPILSHRFEEARLNLTTRRAEYCGQLEKIGITTLPPAPQRYAEIRPQPELLFILQLLQYYREGVALR